MHSTRPHTPSIQGGFAKCWALFDTREGFGVLTNYSRIENAKSTGS